MSQSFKPVMIRLHLPWARYGSAAAICAAMAAGMVFLSVQPNLAKPSMTVKGQAIGRLLMSVEQIAGVWPLAAGAAMAFLLLSLFLVSTVAARRPFELTIDSQGVTWPALAPWRTPWALSWSEIKDVTMNQARDHLVFITTRGRRLMPAWWLPPGTSLADVVSTLTALRSGRR